MAYFDTTWYVNYGDGSTTGYYAVPKRPQNAAVAAGAIVRQFTAPSKLNERVFICRCGNDREYDRCDVDAYARGRND